MTHYRLTHFPFTALVGQDRLKTALLLGAVDPGIGGVLISGEKGTAKSTAARALADLLPPVRVVQGCPYNSPPDEPHYGLNELDGQEPTTVDVPVPLVDLPLGATEDRVLGTLDFEQALQEGRRAFQPGLLARANRGILYIDEVNLLPDHLVDLLLDAAAMGVNVVQREGIEVVHPARFLLIGTMNPEEGELRPQLLDRFGLMVEVSGPTDPETRVEVVRRRMAFESNPSGFTAAWESEQTALRERVVDARTVLPRVIADDDTLQLISRICCETGVSGMRADLVMHKAARGLAALDGRTTVTADDVRQAAELVLPHRRRRQPFEKPGLDRDQLDDLMPPDDGGSSDEDRAEDSGDRQEEPSPGTDDGGPEDEARGESSDATGESDGDAEGQAPQTRTFSAPPPESGRHVEVSAARPGEPTMRGRRNKAADRRSGRYVRAVRDEKPTELAVDATLRSAAQSGRVDDGRPQVKRHDLHRKERRGPAGTLILFVVDASGSMAARRRMEAVKGAVLSLLVDAYQQRDRVAVIAFRGQEAELILPPTGSVERAEASLKSLPTGGRTPLSHALLLASEIVHNARRSDPELLALTVLLTDGKANVSIPGTQGDPWSQTLQAAGALAEADVPALLLDTEEGFVQLGRARELAGALSAEYRQLDELTADALTLQVRQQKRAVSSPPQIGGPRR